MKVQRLMTMMSNGGLPWAAVARMCPENHEARTQYDLGVEPSESTLSAVAPMFPQSSRIGRMRRSDAYQLEFESDLSMVEEVA